MGTLLQSCLYDFLLLTQSLHSVLHYYNSRLQSVNYFAHKGYLLVKDMLSTFSYSALLK